MNNIKVFISSPYSEGDQAENVKLQIDFADKLMQEGFLPFVPLLSHFHHLIHPRPYDEWLEYTLKWLHSCDCLLRVGGHSKGTDKEIELAKRLKIPVFYGIDPLLKWKYN